MFLSVYLFVNPDIPCPVLPQTFFLLCLEYDLFRKAILNMLSIDHASCERLYLCDFNKGSMRSREVVQTFNRTSLSDRAADRVWDFRNPAKIQGNPQKYRVPVPQNAKRHA